MPLTSESILLAQSAMRRAHQYNGPQDGLIHDEMIAVAENIAAVKRSWPRERKMVAYVQQISGLRGDAIDGLWGDETQRAYDALVHRRLFGSAEPSWRPEDRSERNPNNWPSQGSTDAALTAYYGAPGTRLVPLTPPYPHYLAWAPDQQARTIRCHALVRDSLERVLTNVLRIYGPHEISRLRLDQFGGCYNDRPMRGGTRRSTHSWGIALDYDPTNNQLRWGADRASFAHPEYTAWWDCWEEEGWLSLGRTRNFDWMHVQATRI